MEDIESPVLSEDSFWGDESNHSKCNRSNSPSMYSDDYNESISTELLSGLKQFRDTKMFCDIVLKVNNTEIHAHKVILSACSPYFSAMFSGRFNEKNKNVIEMKDIDENTLNLIINYIYTGNLELNVDNVRDILFCANFLHITSAENICCKYLCGMVDAENCIEFMIFSGKRSLKMLFKEATRYAAKMFCKVISETDFLKLDFNEIDNFIRDKEIRQYPDDTLLCAVHKWINYAPEERIKYLSELLKRINPARVTKELISASKYIEMDERSSDWVAQSKQCNDKEWYLYLFNSLSSTTPQRIPLKEKELRGKVPRLPEDICCSTFASYGATIYAQGGWISCETYTDKIYAFDAYKNVWTLFLPLSQARVGLGSCTLQHYMYCAGGTTSMNTVDIMERFDLLTGQVTLCDNLKYPRASFGMCAYENCIYAAGGHDRLKYIKSIERYDPRVGHWEELNCSIYSEGECTCAPLDDNIYIAIANQQSMERYDIRNNKCVLVETLDDLYASEICAVDGNLYGLRSDNLYKYSPIVGEWEMFQNLRVYDVSAIVPIQHYKQRL